MRLKLSGKGKKLASLLRGDDARASAGSSDAPMARDQAKSIFVGNLPFTINEKILENSVIFLTFVVFIKIYIYIFDNYR